MSFIWVPGPIAWIVLRAARLLPKPVRYRLEEEWLADLLALDGLVQKIRFALGCVWAALQMRRERITGTLPRAAQRNITEELPAVKWRLELWIPFFKQRARTREEAFTWLERLRRGLRADDGAQLQAWLTRRSHRKCIARAAADKNGPEDLAFLGEICELNPEWVEARRGRSPLVNAAAALFAIGITSLPYLHLVFPQRSLIEAFGTAYASGRHTVRHVEMPDGTQMALNHETRIAVWYTENMRAGLPMRGEATFTVPHEASRTFLLDAGGRHFGTMGAATFNVRLTGRTIELTVLDGVVGVSALPETEHRTAHVGLAPPTLVKAGQTIDIKPDGQSARSLSQPEAQARIAWQRS